MLEASTTIEQPQCPSATAPKALTPFHVGTLPRADMIVKIHPPDSPVLEDATPFEQHSEPDTRMVLESQEAETSKKQGKHECEKNEWREYTPIAEAEHAEHCGPVRLRVMVRHDAGGARLFEPQQHAQQKCTSAPPPALFLRSCCRSLISATDTANELEQHLNGSSLICAVVKAELNATRGTISAHDAKRGRIGSGRV
jgi:hypothetical protein